MILKGAEPGPSHPVSDERLLLAIGRAPTIFNAIASRGESIAARSPNTSASSTTPLRQRVLISLPPQACLLTLTVFDRYINAG